MSEKIKILKMVEEGKITAEEGIKLLEAVETKKEEIKSIEKTYSAKWLRVKVYDPEDNVKVNVNIPLALVETGIKIGMAYDKNLNEHLDGVDFKEIVNAVKNGAEGKIVDVESEKGEKVEVYVE